jgi:outer membrane protein OmpA-like peptidoglycan-associated protein
VYCDTCTSLVSNCSEQVVNVGEVMAKNNAAAEAETKSKDVAANKPAGKTDQKKSKAKTKEQEKLAVSKNNSGNDDNTGKEMKETVATDVARAESSKGNEFLSEDELLALKWNKQPSYFPYNEYSLSEYTKQVLDENIQVIKNNQTLSVVIKGYADSRGSEAYNKNLSLKRAQAVKEYMVENGVNSKRIIAVKGMGESELVNNCDDNTECSEDQHQANRRVEISLSNRIKTNVITLK